MTRTGHELSDIGRSLSWRALKAFIANIPPESAVAREVNPEAAEWHSQIKTNAILADIFDLLNQINANLVALATRRPAKKPKRYPRPTGKQKADGEKHFGKGALSAKELELWFERKRRAKKCQT